MSKRSRWEECKNKFFSAINSGNTPSREHLKRWGANKIAAKTDVLEVRASYAAKHYALGGLLSVAVCAGKNANWASGRIWALCEKRPGLSLYPYNIRVGS